MGNGRACVMRKQETFVARPDEQVRIALGITSVTRSASGSVIEFNEGSHTGSRRFSRPRFRERLRGRSMCSLQDTIDELNCGDKLI